MTTSVLGRIQRVTALLLLIGSSTSASADLIRLLPGGIVFPELSSAGVYNPGALPRDEAHLIRLMAAPNMFGSSTQGEAIDWTYAREKWGLNAGYALSRTVSGAVGSGMSHSAHVGMGYRFGGLGLGVGYIFDPTTVFSSSTDTTATATGMSGQLNLGLLYPIDRTRIGIVLRDLGTSPSVTLGMGVINDNFTVEGNLALPSFSSGLTSDGSTYVLSLASTLYLTSFGIGYTTTYAYTKGVGSTGSAFAGTGTSFIDTPLGFAHTFALLYRVSKTGSVSFRFDTSNYFTLAVTFGL